jgi:hypothetical protein
MSDPTKSSTFTPPTMTPHSAIPDQSYSNQFMPPPMPKPDPIDYGRLEHLQATAQNGTLVGSAQYRTPEFQVGENASISGSVFRAGDLSSLSSQSGHTEFGFRFTKKF